MMFFCYEDYSAYIDVFCHLNQDNGQEKLSSGLTVPKEQGNGPDRCLARRQLRRGRSL